MRHRINYFPQGVTVWELFTKSSLWAVACTLDSSKPLYLLWAKKCELTWHPTVTFAVPSCNFTLFPFRKRSNESPSSVTLLLKHPSTLLCNGGFQIAVSAFSCMKYSGLVDPDVWDIASKHAMLLPILSRSLFYDFSLKEQISMTEFWSVSINGMGFFNGVKLLLLYQKKIH